MKPSAFLALAAAIVSLAALAVPAHGANRVTVSRFPVSASFFNPCTNENVDFSGTALTVLDPTPEDGHGLVFHSVDIAIKGFGETSGALYVSLFTVVVSLQGTELTPDDGAFAETNVVHSRLVTAGPANDLVFAIVFHFTIDASGEVVAWHNRLTAETCV